MRLRIGTGLVWLAGLAVLPVALGAAEPPPASLDVDEAVRIALRQNYGYRQAEAGVAAAEGNRLDALAGLLPQASGSYAYSKAKQTQTALDLPLQVVRSTGQVLVRGDLKTESRTRYSNLGLSIRQDLSLPLWYRYRSSQADVQSARAGQDAAAQDLAFNVRQQFYLVLRAKALLTVQEDNLKLAQDQERRIQSMFELGSVARVDVLKAKVQVSDAELALIQQQNAVDIERARLATLLGYPAGSDFELTGNLDDRMMPVDSSKAIRDAANRPVLRQAEEDLRSTNNQYRAALLSRLPGLFASFDVNSASGTSQSDGTTTLGLPGYPSPGDTTDALITFPVPESDAQLDGWTVRVGASVSLDALFNAGSQKRAHANKRRAEYALEGLKLDVGRELAEAILNYQASDKAIEAAERGVESAQEDLRLSQERYQQGLGTVLELLEAQVNLTRARNDLVNAQTGLKISEAAVDRARGAELPY